MELRLLDVGLFEIEGWLLDIRGQGLEASTDNVWYTQLPVPVLKEQLALFRHIHPHCGLAYATSFWLVNLPQVSPGVAVETSLTEYFCSRCLD